MPRKRYKSAHAPLRTPQDQNKNQFAALEGFVEVSKINDWSVDSDEEDDDRETIIADGTSSPATTPTPTDTDTDSTDGITRERIWKAGMPTYDDLQARASGKVRNLGPGVVLTRPRAPTDSALYHYDHDAELRDLTAAGTIPENLKETQVYLPNEYVDKLKAHSRRVVSDPLHNKVFRLTDNNMLVDPQEELSTTETQISEVEKDTEKVEITETKTRITETKTIAEQEGGGDPVDNLTAQLDGLNIKAKKENGSAHAEIEAAPATSKKKKSKKSKKKKGKAVQHEEAKTTNNGGRADDLAASSEQLEHGSSPLQPEDSEDITARFPIPPISSSGKPLRPPPGLGPFPKSMLRGAELQAESNTHSTKPAPLSTAAPNDKGRTPLWTDGWPRNPDGTLKPPPTLSDKTRRRIEGEVEMKRRQLRGNEMLVKKLRESIKKSEAELVLHAMTKQGMEDQLLEARVKDLDATQLKVGSEALRNVIEWEQSRRFTIQQSIKFDSDMIANTEVDIANGKVAIARCEALLNRDGKPPVLPGGKNRLNLSLETRGKLVAKIEECQKEIAGYDWENKLLHDNIKEIKQEIRSIETKMLVLDISPSRSKKYELEGLKKTKATHQREIANYSMDIANNNKMMDGYWKTLARAESVLELDDGPHKPRLVVADALKKLMSVIMAREIDEEIGQIGTGQLWKYKSLVHTMEEERRQLLEQFRIEENPVMLEGLEVFLDRHQWDYDRLLGHGRKTFFAGGVEGDENRPIPLTSAKKTAKYRELAAKRQQGGGSKAAAHTANKQLTIAERKLAEQEDRILEHGNRMDNIRQLMEEKQMKLAAILKRKAELEKEREEDEERYAREEEEELSDSLTDSDRTVTDSNPSIASDAAATQNSNAIPKVVVTPPSPPTPPPPPPPRKDKPHWTELLRRKPSRLGPKTPCATDVPEDLRWDEPEPDEEPRPDNPRYYFADSIFFNELRGKEKWLLIRWYGFPAVDNWTWERKEHVKCPRAWNKYLLGKKRIVDGY